MTKKPKRKSADLAELIIEDPKELKAAQDRVAEKWQRIEQERLEQVVKPQLDALGQLAEQAARLYARALEHDYEIDKNPLSAWEAIFVASALGDPPPDWTHDYLKDTSANLMDLLVSLPAGDAYKTKSLKAIGFTSEKRFNQFTNYRVTRRNELKRFWEIHYLIKDGENPGKAYKIVGKRHNIDSNDVRRSYKRILKLYEQSLPKTG